MLRIGIVGGGIGGLAAAIALRAGGHRVEVFEGATAITEVGSGLTLWANATRALRHLGVLDDCVSRSQSIRMFQLRLSRGPLLMQIPIESFATHAFAMHRHDLQQALLRALPASCIATGQRCQGAREDAAGVYLRFAGGERGPYDMVVGADGLRSTLRPYITTDRGLEYQGYTIWRGVAAQVGTDYARDFPEGVISETWGRGHRFGILPLGGGRVCWYMTANRPLASVTAPALRGASIAALVADWHAPIARLVAATPSEAILENPAFDRAIPAQWSAGAMLIIGDAAHPLTPNLGQGVCTALEDAVVLGELLRGCRPDKAAIHARLVDFSTLRTPRVRALARRCRWLGAIGQWQHPLLAPLRNRVARAIPGAYFAYTSRLIQAYAADQITLPPHAARTCAADCR